MATNMARSDIWDFMSVANEPEFLKKNLAGFGTSRTEFDISQVKWCRCASRGSDQFLQSKEQLHLVDWRNTWGNSYWKNEEDSRWKAQIKEHTYSLLIDKWTQDNKIFKLIMPIVVGLHVTNCNHCHQCVNRGSYNKAALTLLLHLALGVKWRAHLHVKQEM